MNKKTKSKSEAHIHFTLPQKEKDEWSKFAKEKLGKPLSKLIYQAVIRFMYKPESEKTIPTSQLTELLQEMNQAQEQQKETIKSCIMEVMKEFKEDSVITKIDSESLESRIKIILKSQKLTKHDISEALDVNLNKIQPILAEMWDKKKIHYNPETKEWWI